MLPSKEAVTRCVNIGFISVVYCEVYKAAFYTFSCLYHVVQMKKQENFAYVSRFIVVINIFTSLSTRYTNFIFTTMFQNLLLILRKLLHKIMKTSSRNSLTKQRPKFLKTGTYLPNKT